VAPAHDVLGQLEEEFHGPTQFVLHGLLGPAVWLAAAGVALAWFLCLKRPDLAAVLRQKAGGLYTLLENKYYFDWFNEKVIAAGSRKLGMALWKGGDVAVIDGAAVNGSARLVTWVAQTARGLQSGYLYHYAFATIIGLSVLLAWLLWRS
jgi:NADH-quinone oxidoreductase subunit L